MHVGRKLDTYRAAIRRALDWAAVRVHEDGTIAGSEAIAFGYYKAIPAFWAGGHPLEAGRIVKCIRRDFYQDTRFERGEPYAGGSVGPAYRDGWFAIGTHLLGAYDMSVPVLSRLERDLDAVTGGVHNAEDDPYTDLGITCSACTALLAGGRIDAATRAGKAVETILHAQPDPRRMVMRWHPEQGFADPSSSPGIKGWSVEIGGRKQVYWYLGFAMYVFARLYRATGQSSWLASANQVLEFVSACRDDFAGNMNTSKLAWGASQMAMASPDPRYRDLALDVADWMAESQSPEGLWVRNPAQFTAATQPVPISLDSTLDRAFYLTEVVAAFA